MTENVKALTYDTVSPPLQMQRRYYNRIDITLRSIDSATADHLNLASAFVRRDGDIYITCTKSPNTANLRAIIESCGLFILAVSSNSDKITIHAVPPTTVEKVDVHGPPGLGDIIWTLNKIDAIREREHPCRINYVVCYGEGLPEKEAQRAKDFLNACGLIDSCTFQPAQLPSGKTICPDISKPVYHLFANPCVDSGGSLDEWHSDYPSNYDVRFSLPESAERHVVERTGGKPYTTVYFSSVAWNTECTAGQAWTPKEWAETVIYLNSIGLKPVLLGAEWDRSYANLVAECLIDNGVNPEESWINLIGRTPLLLALAFMRYAAVNIGSGSSGLTVTAAYMGYKVLTLWPKAGVLPVEPYICRFIKDGFSTCWVPPDIAKLDRYKALHFGEFSLDDVKAEIQRLCYSPDSRPPDRNADITLGNITALRLGVSDCEIVWNIVQPCDAEWIKTTNNYAWYYAIGKLIGKLRDGDAINILEMGVRYGYSAVSLIAGAVSAGKLRISYTGVDNEYDGVRSNEVAAVNVQSMLASIDGDSYSGARIFNMSTADMSDVIAAVGPLQCDIVHVDGDHSMQGIANELSIASTCVKKPDGIILVDDCDVEHIHAAVLDFCTNTGGRAIFLPTMHKLAVISAGTK